MRVVPERSPWWHFASVLGGFAAGPFAAARLGSVLVPGSELVQTVAAFGFAAVFIGGTMIWMGLGVAVVVVRALGSLVRGRLPRPAATHSDQRMVPPGYRSYVFLGAFVGVGVGLLAGAVTELTIPAAAGAWTLLGTGYGLALWAAAHHGYLPFPEPE